MLAKRIPHHQLSNRPHICSPEPCDQEDSGVERACCFFNAS